METRTISLVPSLDQIMLNDTSLFGHDVSQIWLQWERAYLTQVANIIDHPAAPAELIESGCKVYGSLDSDCTKACRNITTMFGSPETLWNCVTLATLSILTRQNHSTDNGPYLINEAQAIKANKSLNFDLETFDFPFGNYRPCALESCIVFGRCHVDITQFLTSPINNSRINELASMMSGYYCTSAQPGIDLDIAGPGVSLPWPLYALLRFLLSWPL